MGYLRLSLTEHASPSDGILSAGEIARLLGAFARAGVTKVRFIGEPLRRDDLLEIVAAAARTLGLRTVALTTNGVGFADRAEDLLWVGLQRANFNLDSLDRGTYWDLAGEDVLPEALAGLEAALALGLERVKVNMVVRRGINDQELPAFCDLARRTGAEVRFAELMPDGRDLRTWSAGYLPAGEMRARLGALEPLPSRGHSSARRYLLPGGGVIGFISPLSEPFCPPAGECRRVHVTACGKLRPCARAPFAADLRPLLSLADLEVRVSTILAHLGQLKQPRARPAPAGRTALPRRSPTRGGGIPGRRLRVLH